MLAALKNKIFAHGRVSARKILKGGQNPGAEFFARNLKYIVVRYLIKSC
jgi:hypothetical protein